MKKLTGKTLAATLIAGLLVLASFENHADELEFYLDDAMHTQVLEELKVNVQRLYECEWLINPAQDDGDEYLQAKGFGFPLANRGTDLPVSPGSAF